MDKRQEYEAMTMPQLLGCAGKFLQSLEPLLPKSAAHKTTRSQLKDFVAAINARLVDHMVQHATATTKRSASRAAGAAGKLGRPSRAYYVASDVQAGLYRNIADAALAIGKKPQSIHNAISKGNGIARFYSPHPNTGNPMETTVEPVDPPADATFIEPVAPAKRIAGAFHGSARLKI